MLNSWSIINKIKTHRILYLFCLFSILFQNQQTSQKIEVINGGYGIKNPSFIPPKPADITNIQHGRYN